MRKIILLLFLLLGLGGCVVGPKYKRPVIQPPDKYYTEANPQSNSLADTPWWEIFKDPVLQDLIREALKNNYDVATAAHVSKRLGHRRAWQSPSTFRRSATVADIAGAKSRVVPNHVYYGYNFDLSWELDLWGRIRKLNEQQRALFFASQDVQRGVWLSLVADVAQAYFELRALDVQLDITKETGQSFQETYDLFSKKLQGGAASGLETSRAEAAMANVLAQVPDLERQITAKENQISLLARQESRADSAWQFARRPRMTLTLSPLGCPRPCWSDGPIYARQSSSSSRPTLLSALPRLISFRCSI